VFKELEWSKERLDQVIKPFVKCKVVYIKQSKKGMSIAYWERIQGELEPVQAVKELSDEDKLNESNKQLRNKP